jgi:hypothetical protein
MAKEDDDYLRKVLKAQTLKDDGPELKDLRQRRKDIEATLRAAFPDSPISIRWAGSMAKCTMILASYDGDMTCYFNHDEIEAGRTLEEIYEAVEKALQNDYMVERKASALRVKDRESETYLHVDVVPGRFTGDEKDDVFLHRTRGDKCRLKTNLGVHIEHIRDSGVTDAVRLMKLWNCREAIGAKTFVLELLVVKLLAGKRSSALSSQLTHVWTKMRDDSENLSVEDPANPEGNNLKPELDRVRAMLASAATRTLQRIDDEGWEAVFGEVEEEDDAKAARRAALSRAAAASPVLTRPWACDDAAPGA